MTQFSDITYAGYLALDDLLSTQHPLSDQHDEMLFVVEGELTLIGEAGESKCPAGASASFARGELHGYRNDTAQVVRLIVVATPGLQAAEMFRHFDRAAKTAPLAPPAIAAIAAEYGVRFG